MASHECKQWFRVCYQVYFCSCDVQSETLCVFDVVEAAWPFFSVSEIKKAKKKKTRVQCLSWPARICITFWNGAAKRWTVVSLQCVRNEGINSAMNLLPDIYYLPAYAIQRVWSFLSDSSSDKGEHSFQERIVDFVLLSGLDHLHFNELSFL